MRMSADTAPIVPRNVKPAYRGYRIALTISFTLNVLLGAALYLYSSVESFMSVIGMVVGTIN